MRSFYLLLFLLTALPFCAFAQQFRGRVYDADNSGPIGTVLITNTHSGAMWVSDSIGNCAFTAYPGDVINFSHPAYKPFRLQIMGEQDVVSVGLSRAPVQLAEVQVLSPMARFQRDSAFNHQFFHKELGYTKSQVKMDYSGGVGTTGLISELALGLSGKKKYYKRFAEDMIMLEELRYSSIRYTPSLVATQTGLNDSAAAAFINRHPIPNDFVRVASELELKMWVREQYRAELAAEPPKEKQYIGKSR